MKTKMSFPNEIEKVKAEIKMLQKKLEFYKELEKTKSPVEEAYRRWWGEYPKDDDNGWEIDNTRWRAFQVGYNYAQEDYKVGEYQEEPEENEWKNVALEFGKKLPVILPYNYDELPPDAWFRWVVFTYDKYMEQRDKESGYTPTPQTPEQEECDRIAKQLVDNAVEEVKMTKQQLPDTIEIGGVKYAKVVEEEPGQPKTLYQMFWENDWNVRSCEVFCDIVKEWMSQYTHNVMSGEYLRGYEDCMLVLEENLK
jgi:hypothetical protein